MSWATPKLPAALLARAVQSSPGREYAWRIDDIPEVIEAARSANLVSVGGQLQFRLPDDGTCECYWIEVDTYKSVDAKLPWIERVTLTAETAAREFAALQQRYDFIAEGRKAFAPHLDAHGGAECMCFVWYVLSEAEEG